MQLLIFLFIGKPDSPKSIEVTCDVKRARVKWKSSFNGGDPQMFTAFAINGQQGTHSQTLPDRGENEIHETFVENLQPSLTYVFYVSARNSQRVETVKKKYNEYFNENSKNKFSQC